MEFPLGVILKHDSFFHLWFCSLNDSETSSSFRTWGEVWPQAEQTQSCSFWHTVPYINTLGPIQRQHTDGNGNRTRDPTAAWLTHSAAGYWRHVCSAPTEPISTTWRTSYPSSSWGPSTPWRDPPWPWPAFTFWFSSAPGQFTPSPTCTLCAHRPGLWPTPWPRSPASPWRCRSWSPWQRTRECNTRTVTVRYHIFAPQLGFGV